jgi:hypothetical protein
MVRRIRDGDDATTEAPQSRRTRRPIRNMARRLWRLTIRSTIAPRRSRTPAPLPRGRAARRGGRGPWLAPAGSATGNSSPVAARAPRRRPPPRPPAGEPGRPGRLACRRPHSIAFRTSGGHAAGTASGAVEIHLDAVDGPILTTVTINGTASATTYATHTFPLADPGGLHKIHLVFRPVAGGPGKNFFNLNWTEFGGTGIAVP